MRKYRVPTSLVLFGKPASVRPKRFMQRSRFEPLLYHLRILLTHTVSTYINGDSRNCSRPTTRSAAILSRACEAGQIVGVSRLLSLSGLIAVRSLIHLFKPNPNALSSNALSQVAIHLKQLHREFYCVLSAPVQRFSSARS